MFQLVVYYDDVAMEEAEKMRSWILGSCSYLLVLVFVFPLFGNAPVASRKIEKREDGLKSSSVENGLMLRDVRIAPLPAMISSSTRYMVRGTVEVISKEEAPGSSETVLQSGPFAPLVFSLAQNYPNPFNPSTTITFTVPDEDSGETLLQIYDIRGRLVRILVDEELAPGSYHVHWDGRDDRGEELSSGVYLYRLQRGGNLQTRKMTLVR